MIYEEAKLNHSAIYFNYLCYNIPSIIISEHIHSTGVKKSDVIDPLFSFSETKGKYYGKECEADSMSKVCVYHEEKESKRPILKSTNEQIMNMVSDTFKEMVQNALSPTLNPNSVNYYTVNYANLIENETLQFDLEIPNNILNLSPESKSKSQNSHIEGNGNSPKSPQHKIIPHKISEEISEPEQDSEFESSKAEDTINDLTEINQEDSKTEPTENTQNLEETENTEKSLANNRRSLQNNNDETEDDDEKTDEEGTQQESDFIEYFQFYQVYLKYTKQISTLDCHYYEKRNYDDCISKQAKIIEELYSNFEDSAVFNFIEGWNEDDLSNSNINTTILTNLMGALFIYDISNVPEALSEGIMNRMAGFGESIVYVMQLIIKIFTSLLELLC